MARDRQRAKHRRRRPSSGGDAARPAVPREDLEREEPVEPTAAAPGDDTIDAAPDSGVEDVADERGAPGTTPTPDPLKHVSPYVDEAKLAEAGVPVEDADAEGAEPAPAESGYSSRPADRSEQEGHAVAEAPRSRSGRARSFLRHSAQELKRVQWPDRRQTGQGTVVVLGFVVLAGGFLGLMDAIWKPLIEAII